MELSFRLYAELRHFHDVLSSGDFTEWLPLRTGCPILCYMHLRGLYSSFILMGHKINAVSKAEHFKLAQAQPNNSQAVHEDMFWIPVQGRRGSIDLESTWLSDISRQQLAGLGIISQPGQQLPLQRQLLHLRLLSCTAEANGMHESRPRLRPT